MRNGEKPKIQVNNKFFAVSKHVIYATAVPTKHKSLFASKIREKQDKQDRLRWQDKQG